eukprot:PhM_4_TR508/c0_g1_i1/m.42375/K02566/nagD; NagD protein
MNKSLVKGCLMALLVALTLTSGAHADCGQLHDVDGYIIDLDGTMYMPDGLIPGALKFYDWLLATNKPFVFLSNSAAKGPQGVQTKFLTSPFNLSETPVPLSKIRTAANGIASYVDERVPANSSLYIIQTTSNIGGVKDSCLQQLQLGVRPELWATFNWRTDLTDDEILEWAWRTWNNNQSTHVIFCPDADIDDTADPVTHKPGYTTWSYNLIGNVERLVNAGATFVASAPDTHVVKRDPRFPGMPLDTPGGGAFGELIVAATYPRAVNRTFNTGKGGNAGTEFMVGPALAMLRAQGASGDPRRTAIVGDTLNTDIAAGTLAGLLSVFVLSGVNTVADQPYFPEAVPNCTLPSVGEIPDAAKG